MATAKDKNVFRTPYPHYQTPGIAFPEASLTRQEFVEESDINNIMKQYIKTGQLPAMIQKEPRYGDFSNAPSYHEAANLVALSHEQFDNLPAKVRERFKNDPSLFLAFATDADNIEEMVRLGLATKSASAPIPDPIKEGEKSPSRGSGGTPDKDKSSVAQS